MEHASMDIEQLIAARPTARRQRSAWYGDLIDTAEREGVTLPSLAKRLGVVAETLYAQRRKRRDRPGAEATRRAAAGLVRVRIAEPTAVVSNDRPLELRLARDRSVLIHRGFDREHLVALLSALERC
jgi:transposase-like protein